MSRMPRHYRRFIRVADTTALPLSPFPRAGSCCADESAELRCLV